MNQKYTSPTQEDFCKKYNLTPEQFSGESPYFGTLSIKEEKAIPNGFSPVIWGKLHFDDLLIWPDNFNPVVSGVLSVAKIDYLPENFNPIIGGDLMGYEVSKVPDNFTLKVGGTIYLGALKILPKGFNPVCGRSLLLPALKYVPSEYKPIVGIGFSFRIIRAYPTTHLSNNAIFWGEKYMMADDMFVEILHKRGEVYKTVSCLPCYVDEWCAYPTAISKDTFYTVTDGKGNWAHGSTIKEAREDLFYKNVEKNLSTYEGLPLDHTFTFEEAIKAYRSITGACRFGVENLLKQNSTLKGKSFTVQEIIGITENQYGGSIFKEFFIK